MFYGVTSRINSRYRNFHLYFHRPSFHCIQGFECYNFDSFALPGLSLKDLITPSGQTLLIHHLFHLGDHLDYRGFGFSSNITQHALPPKEKLQPLKVVLGVVRDHAQQAVHHSKLESYTSH